MSVCKKCDICGTVFDLGFSVEVDLQGGIGFQDVGKYRFDIGHKDICTNCFNKMKLKQRDGENINAICKDIKSEVTSNEQKNFIQRQMHKERQSALRI